MWYTEDLVRVIEAERRQQRRPKARPAVVRIPTMRRRPARAAAH
jgi:vacuolar-type H+-ATPase subunit F/Vma7